MTVPFDTGATLAAQSGVRHGFFGRRGGISTGDWAALNMSDSTGDAAENIARNRALAAEALGFAPDQLALVKQVHSADVVVVRGPLVHPRPEADALVTDQPGVLLGILTADCSPVLLADAGAGVIGALHAGWKGAIGGIAPRTVKAMVALGAEPARIVAAIGPTISLPNYEVGPQFAADLLRQHPGAASRISVPPGGREHFDLPGFVLDQLHAAGVGSVADLKLCTYADPERFFSHRFATHRGSTTGRQLALIGMG